MVGFQRADQVYTRFGIAGACNPPLPGQGPDRNTSRVTAEDAGMHGAPLPELDLDENVPSVRMEAAAYKLHCVIVSPQEIL
jgi:hypothetical protein